MKHHLLSLMCLLQASTTYALPTNTPFTSTSTSAISTSTSTPTWDFTSGAVTTYPIHPSCNITLRRQLERALELPA